MPKMHNRDFCIPFDRLLPFHSIGVVGKCPFHPNEDYRTLRSVILANQNSRSVRSWLQFFHSSQSTIFGIGSVNVMWFRKFRCKFFSSSTGWRWICEFPNFLARIESTGSWIGKICLKHRLEEKQVVLHKSHRIAPIKCTTTLGTAESI